MMRVYAALKARILSGEFAPGERLDPARLAPSLGASRTPVRDALHRLSGERLVDTWEDEGFRQPFVSELTIRDLYEWGNDVLQAAIRTAAHRPGHARPVSGPMPSDYPGAASWCFLHVAGMSANDEHRTAVMAVNDRTHLLRHAELDVLDGAMDEIHALSARLSAERDGLAQSVGEFHRRRVRAIPAIAARLRSMKYPTQ
jgi:DNA-binding transcriptional MocR family regulator